MKKIDSNFRHLPEEEALEAMRLEQSKREGVRMGTAQLNADENGPRQQREKLLLADRRKFMNLVAKSGIATGLIRAFPLIGGVLSSRYALAQENPHANKRVVYCYVASGDWDDSANWLPANVGDKKWLSGHYADHGVAQYCHFRQLHTIAEGHGGAMSAMAGNNYDTRNLPTVDARIASVLGATTPIKGLYLGSGARADQDPQFQYISNMDAVEQDPARALSKMLGAAKPAGTPDQAVVLAFDEQMRALNSIKSKLSADEYWRIEGHLTELQTMKKNYVAATASIPCSNVMVNAANIKERAKSHARIIAAALACGVTNVATLQIGNAQGGNSWRAHDYQGIDPHCAHSGGNARADFLNVHSYCYNASAYLLQELAKTIGPDGKPLLTSTVFAQVTCFGRANAHSAHNAPFLLATQRPEFRAGFSASGANGQDRGSARTLHNDIIKGLGLTGVVTLAPEAANVNLGLLS